MSTAMFLEVSAEAERLWQIDYPNRNASTMTACRQLARYFPQARRNVEARRA